MARLYNARATRVVPAAGRQPANRDAVRSTLHRPACAVHPHRGSPPRSNGAGQSIPAGAALVKVRLTVSMVRPRWSAISPRPIGSDTRRPSPAWPRARPGVAGNQPASLPAAGVPAPVQRPARHPVPGRHAAAACAPGAGSGCARLHLRQRDAAYAAVGDGFDVVAVMVAATQSEVVAGSTKPLIWRRPSARVRTSRSAPAVNV